MALKKITFLSHPITWTWSKVSGLAASLFGANGEDEVYLGTPGAIDSDDPKFTVPCMVSQIIVVVILFYLLYRFLKSIKF